MREELDQRIRVGLRADVDQLPLRVTEAMVEERLARPRIPSIVVAVAWLVAGVVTLVLVALVLSLLSGIRNVGPQVTVPRSPDAICSGRIDAADPVACLSAVQAATAVLATGQDPFRATFLRGRAFGCQAPCAEDVRRDGTVVLEFPEPGSDLFVTVTLGSDGEWAVSGDPLPVPGGQFDPGDPGHVRATWQYVALGTGFTGNATWPARYADQVATDMGVAVELQMMAAAMTGGGTARADLSLEQIRTDGELRGRIAEAEVITVGPGIEELRQPMLAFVRGDGTCGGVDDQDCIRAAMTGVRADWEALLEELARLRSPEAANVIVVTQATWLADWACGEWGSACWEVLAGHWVDFYDFVAASARQRGLKVADTLAALHAPGVLDAPVNPAYVGVNGMDVSDEGSSVVVEVLRDAGY